MNQKKPEKRRFGVWVDHEGAVIVTLIGKDIRTARLLSEVERHTRLSGGSRSATIYGPQDVASESTHNRRFQNQLATYYEKLIGKLRDADELFIFGPGEAKKELKKALEKHKAYQGKTVGIEAADKMTEAQIVAKVRQRFSTT